MPNELPFFPLYTSDIMTAVASWPAERVGAYFLALCYQWEHGSVPTADVASLGLVLHVSQPARARKLWAEIAVKFQIDADGHARNARLEAIRTQVRAEVAAKSDRGKAGAGARWDRFRKRIADAQASTQGDAQASPEHSSNNANQNQTQYTPPLPPAARGDAHVAVDTSRVTRSERSEALQALADWRREQGGRAECPHQDGTTRACETEEICVGIVVQRWRVQRARGQQRALMDLAVPAEASPERESDASRFRRLHPRGLAPGWQDECADLHGGDCASDFEHWTRSSEVPA